MRQGTFGLFLASASPIGRTPKRTPFDTKFCSEFANGREAHANHIQVVAFDVVDERTAESINRECAGHLEWFAARDVSIDLSIAHVREVHGRSDCPLHLLAIKPQAVPRI